MVPLPKIARYDQQGGQQGEVELDGEIFGEDVNEYAVHSTVVAQMAAKRAGTASTKTRGEKRGGGRKPWRQKGTGRARHGSIRSPLWVGGGTTFGPQPRSYKKRIPRKVRKLALRSALTAKYDENQVHIVDRLEFKRPKTKDMVSFLETLGLVDSKVLIVIPERDMCVEKSASNLPGVHVITASRLNVYDILDHEHLVIVEGALGGIKEVAS